MSADPSAASWHPAHMPNSSVDITPAEPSSESHLEGSAGEVSLGDSKPHSTLATPEIATHQDVIDALNTEQQVDSILDNTANPELHDPQNAPTASLASLEGVGMDGGSLHNHEDSSEVAEAENFDPPSEDSAQGSKHLSTISFARTVSEEVNWGEDDEVDPEWNLPSTHTDPFKSMAQTDRTNSFPDVPPAHATTIDHHQRVASLAQSQAEEIMNEVEQEPKDLFSDDGNDGDTDFFARQAESQYTDQNEGNEREGNYATDYGQALGGDFGQGEEEARYEEGMPLVQQAETSEGRSPAVAFLGDGEEDDFFAQVGKSDNEPAHDGPRIPSLERKSTSQVIGSLDLQPHGQAQPDIAEETEDIPRPSLDLATGGGIAVSASTVLSKVLADPEHPVSDFAPDSAEGDLAAKWQAALAGDEFLDDDELLPDEDSAALDPAAVFGSDDEGFLEDTDDVASPPVPAAVVSPNGTVVGFDNLAAAARPIASNNNSSRYLPPGATTAVPRSSNTYAPSGPALTDLSKPATTASVPSPYMSPIASTFQQQQASVRPEMPKAQSFANQSKGGYSSPYDLPMEVVKPRKRVSMQQMNRGYTTPAAPTNTAPPRSTSMYAQPPPRESAPSLPTPQSSHSNQQGQTQAPKTVKKTASGFFEDLPMSSRPKPAPRQSMGGSGSQNPGILSPPLGAPPQSQPNGIPRPQAPPVQQRVPQVSPVAGGLVAPERVSPYASLPTAPVAPPPASSRYSPAPTQPQTAPLPAVSRYSPAPPAQPLRQQSQPYSQPPGIAPPPPVLAHQPRTSSPLAHFERSQDSRYSTEQSFDRRSSSTSLRASHLPSTREVDENEHFPNTQNQTVPHPPHPMRPVSTPPPQHSPVMMTSPPKRTPSAYLPQQPSGSTPPQSFVPPQRSQTQSPSLLSGQRREAPLTEPYQRPASVEVPTSPRSHTETVTMSTFSSQGRPRGLSQALNYIAPTDGREHDPMQRWRGAPVFTWGVGGTLITSFPKDVPRYGMGQTVPMVLRSPGEVKTRNIKEVDPLHQRLSSFPGPLKGKSKKKEVITWLGSGIDLLEQDASYLRTIPQLSHEDKRTEERILLWKILRVFIENDGILEGNPVVEKAVRAVLSPGLGESNDSTQSPLYATGADLTGISHSSTTGTLADPVDPYTVDQLRKHLLLGQREKAVWEAVDKRLWAHAMLISNTVSKELYKQVAQEFVQKEVKNIGDNVEPLAALYEIFAGNFEESIDELVPPSARAGFQMVSTSNVSGPSKDALQGLDRWRETLGLVLSNRSMDDIQALNSLGKLLSGYGRAEAAHICFLFSRNVSVFGGIDDPSVSMVLVGSDHLRQPYEFDKEMEPILLSEVFEYGLSLSSVSNVPVSTGHLSIYKLQHATILAEYGYREKALQYCESIAASITSQTRRSPYHHAQLVAAVEDLGKRLKQSPKDANASWISKPSVDKVSGTLGSLFNKFVAGEEDSPAGSTTGSGAESGPFARIAGETPTISPSPSSSDLYGSYTNGLGINGAAMPMPMPATKAASRYAPNRQYTPESASYGSQPRTSLDGRSSSEYGRYEPQRQMSQVSDYQPSPQPAANASAPQMSNSYTPQGSYTPSVPSSSPYTPQQMTPFTEQPNSNIHSSPQAVNGFDGPQPSNSYAPLQLSKPDTPSEYGPSPSTGYEPPSSNSHEPEGSGGYEPPSYGGYEPPNTSTGYVPYEPEPDSPIETKPKKKSFMDDADDDIPALKAAPAVREKTKAEKDREADEAFRKAAEADAARDKDTAAPAKKGWGLSGWFGGGGKKDEKDMGAQPQKAIRAKLGESSSFVYDPDLKRWINKKGGDTAPTPTATPPPPKASGPPRTLSGPPGPTSMPRAPPPASRASSSELKSGSPGPLDGTTPPPLPLAGSDLAPPAMARSVSNGSVGGPPSRPGTSMSNASSIDDLLGPATGGAARKSGGTARKKKGRGYVDVMAKDG